MNPWVQFLLVATGGACGSVSRFGVQRLALRRFGDGFPVGTVVANVSGCFLIGFLAALLARRGGQHSETLRLALSVGFLGGYTTFSSYALETANLAHRQAWLLAAVNLIGTVVAAMLALGLGMLLAKRFG